MNRQPHSLTGYAAIRAVSLLATLGLGTLSLRPALVCAQSEPAATQPASTPDSLEKARRAALESIAKQKAAATSQPAAQLPAMPPPVTPPVKAPPTEKPTTAPQSTPPVKPGPAAPPPAKTPPDAAGTAPMQPAAPKEPVKGEFTTLSFTVSPPSPEDRSYRFDYENAPWADVLNDFSRMSGLAFLNPPDPPITDNLTFRSPKDMTYREALAQLNDLLVNRPLNKYLIRQQDTFLVIKRLPDWMREIEPSQMFDSFEEMEASDPDDYDIVLVNMEVPEGWSPYEIIEKYRPLFTDTYGTQVNGNRLELTGMVWEHRRFRNVVFKLVDMTDGPPPSDPRPMLRIELKNARAADVQTMLRQLYPLTAPAPAAGRGPGVDQTAELAKKVDILSDVKNNIIIVKAPPRMLSEIAEMTAKLDTGTGLTMPVMKVVKLEFADPNTLAGTLKPIFMKEQQAIMKPDGPYVSAEQKADMERDIFPDPASNSVIIIGGKSGVEDAERLVRQWDTPGENTIDEIIELKHADASDIAGILAQIFPAAPKPGQTGDKFTPRTSTSLLVSVSKRTYEKMKALIAKLDVPGEDEEQEHIVQPKAIPPSALAAVLQQAMSGGGPGAPRIAAPKRPGQQPPAPPASPSGAGPRFIPDDGTGYLIVYAVAEDWDRIEPLIKKLDDKAETYQPRLAVFALARANATDVVNMLQQMFPAQPPAAGAPAPQQVSFFADLYNNAVQVFASNEFIAKITPFITQLDIEATAPLTVIKLQHADAETIAPILAQTVGGTAVSSAPQIRPQPGKPGQPPQQPAQTVAPTGGSTRIVAEPITNSLLVSAPPKDMEQIRKLVDEIEAEASEQKAKTEATRVIMTASHRPAEELVETLKYLAAPPKQLPGGPRAVVANQEVAAAEAEGLKIVASGQQVIIDGPRDQVAKAIQLFEQIDVPREGMIFRKYAVNDAEKDVVKLREMLAQSQPPTVQTGTAPGGKGGPAARPAPAPKPSAPESILIHSDSEDNTILVGARLESDLKQVEDILQLIFREPVALEGGPEGSTDGLPFFMVKLQYRKAFDIAFDVEDILNPDSKDNGLRFDEGPTEKLLMVRNCRPGQRERVEEVIKVFDVPESGITREGFRMLDSEKMPPEMLVRLLQQQYNKPISMIPLSDAAGRVKVIDIHADEEPAAPVERTRSGDINPCVLPATMLVSLASLPIGQARANESAELLEPAVCPICHQSPCSLPTQLLRSLDAIAMAHSDDGLEPEDESQAPRTGTREFSAKEPKVVQPAGEVAAGDNQPEAKSRDEGVSFLYDAESGKIILKGPEEELEIIEELIDEITSEDQPTVFRVFPLKYADVSVAAQLLEQVFNQGQAVAASGRRGRQQQQPQMPVPMPQQQGGQPGQPGKPGQPNQAQQQQMMMQQQMAAQQGPTRVKVVPDPRTKSLFVAAVLSDVPLIIEVLKKIDAPVDALEKTIKIFNLENLDATQVVVNLREVLGVQPPASAQGPQQRGGRGFPQQGGQPQEQQIVQMQGQQGQSVTLSSTESIELTADAQTNSIIAKAPPDTLALIEDLIEQLEARTNTTKAEMRRVPLVHARATDVATIVKEVATQVVGAGGGGGGRFSRRFGGGAPGGGGGGGSTGQVSVNADARTNSVILAGATKDVERVAQIVKEMDIPSDGGAIQQFTVKGDASAIAATLKSLYVTGNATDVIITGDNSTGVVVVKAPPNLMKEIGDQLQAMDDKVAGTKEIKTIKLVLADPEQVAMRLQEIFTATRGAGGARQTITIKGNKNNSTLYVMGADEETFEQIQGVATGMDMQPSGIQVKRFPLQHANATEINTQLTDMLVKAKASGGLEGVKLDFVGAVPDPRTNSLIVTGGPITFLLIGDVLKEVDVQPSNEIARDTRSYQLPMSVDINQMAANIQAAFASSPGAKTGLEPPTVTPNAASNMLIVTANGRQHEEIKTKIIDPVVAAVGSEFADYRVPLKFIRAEDAKATLEDFMVKWQQSRGGKPQDRFAITADQNSNLLLVNCTPATKEFIDKQLVEIDVPTGKRETRFVTLKYARADEVARAMATSFQGKTVPNSKGQWPVTAVPDVTSNTVIVTAMSDLWPEVDAMVAALDVAGDSTRAETTVELVNTRPADVAQSLQQVFNAAIAGKPGRTAPTITAVPGTTRLVVFATESELAQIRNLVTQIDEEGSKGRMVHTVTMPELVPAKTVAEAIKQLFGTNQPDGIKAEYHEPTNTLLVSATEREFARIKEQVIDKISTQPTIGTMKPFRIPLKYAVADEVAKTLQEFFDKKAGLKSNQSNLPPWMRGNEPAKQIENQVSIVAEPTSNMLLVFCTDVTKELIDEIIKEIDIDPTTKSVMEMVTLKYVDAAEMLEILTEYLKVSKRTPEDGGRQFVPWWADREQKSEDKTVLAGDMRLKAVDSLNAIIVVGSKDGVADAVAKIKELDVERPDSADAPQRLALANGNPTEIADTLTKLFADPNLIKSKGASYIAPIIVADEGTKSIIVRGKSSDFNLIKKMVDTLDKEMEGDTGAGVRVLAVPAGRDLEELARNIEKRINDAENNRSRIQKDYKPSLVSIGADIQARALVVAGSRGKFEEVKAIVDELVAMAPTGGTKRVVIPLKQLTPQEAKQLIEQFQQSGKGKSGPRSDAQWTRNRRYDVGRGVRGGRQVVCSIRLNPGHTLGLINALQNRARPETVEFCESTESTETAGVHESDSSGTHAIACAGSLPVIMMQVALSGAMAQSSASQPATRPSGPVIGTIRPRAATTQPAARPPQQPARPGAQQPAGRQMTAEDMIRSAVQRGQMDATQMTDAAKEALGRKLSGAPISVAEAGADNIVIEASEEDIEVIMSILEMLDTAAPGKIIEYIALSKASATDLAKTLTDVFSKVEQKGQRQVRPEDKVDIIADQRTNGLYIAATEEKMKQVRSLIEQNEIAAGKVLQQVKTFTFQNRRVAEVGEVLKKMVTAYLTQKGLDPKLIQLEIDPQTNTVFVTANETDLAFVTQIIAGLDAALPPPKEGEAQPIGEADVMIIPLRIAQADALGTLLSDLLKKAATGDTPMKDFIRRFRLLDERGEPIATVNLDRPIVIFGDKESNSLVIASTKANCLIMKQVAMAFDKEPARAEVAYKVFTLQNADATEVAEQVSKLLTDGENLTARPGKSEKSGVPDGEAGALVYKAVVTADARTNQVVLVGRPEAVSVLSDLVTGLDVKGLDVMPFTLVQLEYASVTALEKALSEMMKERAEALPKGTSANAGKSETVIIKGDPRSKSLIIAAKANRLEELRGLIKQLDVPSTALVDDIRTITLRNTSAGDLATKLKDLWEQRAAQQEGGESGFKLEVPAIVADERSNSLIVAASKGDFDAIKGVVDKIEALELNPMANIYVLRLKFNSASSLQAAFKALFEKRAQMRSVDGKVRPEDEVAIEVDETTNSLLFAGSRENYDVLELKVKELDQELGVPGVVEYFVCENVGANRVKDTIESLFEDNGVYKPGATGESEAAQRREKVTVSVDDRSNTLIVSASPENMALVREIYQRMNSVTTPWDVAITRMVVLEHADCVKIAAQVADYFKKLDELRDTGGEGSTKSGFGITVFSDERSNRIIVGGTKDGIDSAVELIRRLDVPPGKPGQLTEVYTLKEAPAAKIGEMIKAVFEERNKPREGGEGAGVQVPSVTVTVEPDAGRNALLINASREDHLLIADLISRLDRPSTILQMARVIPLEKAPAERIKEILEELYQSGEGGEGREGGKVISVVEDKRTNSVVVTAPPGELANIVALVERLDTTEVKGQAEIGVILCENEDAEKMAEVLNQIMTGQGGEGSTGSTAATAEEGGQRALSSMLISYADRDPRGREIFLKTIRENVQITFSTRTNSVIAVAPPPTLRLIESLVRRLDTIQKRSVLVKVFSLRNSDATKMVEILENMFAQEEGQEEEAEFQRDRSVEVEGGTTSTGGVPTAASQEGDTRKGTFGRPKTTFVPDERTNSIIVAGWPEDIDVVADVIDQLDSRPIQDRDNFVYTLVNQTADEMQAALQEYFDAEVQRLESLGETVSPQRLMEQEVSIISHPESNQLVISASPRYKNQVISIIEQLDTAPPQVMIQVMIAEVTLDDRFEMGLEFALQELRFSETAVADSNGILQSSHFDVVGGTDLGAAGSGLGGFSFTITGEDFNFLVRALQADSRLEIIQRPMIMCQDNQQATIQIGQSVPTPQGAQTFGGQTSTQVTYTDVGVILNVEPHINPDGFVYMLVEPEISSITDSTIQIAPGSFAPIFNRRTASTNVAVKDGETVVIGGLITTSETESESKVPLLGDVPGLGMLFRTTNRLKNRTELMIALTPKVVRTVEDARRLSIEKRDESGIITDEMKQSPLFDRLRIEPPAETQIEDFETLPGQEEDMILQAPPVETAQPLLQPPPVVSPRPVMQTPPGQMVPVTPPQVPPQAPPSPRPATQPPKYGPKPTRYGPVVPSGEDVVARRNADSTGAGQ
ncbi:MAG: hypothetical protein DCC65_08665 [Planctomycetota bacterium]|nr:MAG: hypothetical protein DCC65_08665 [Planctomycetota bacterium]